MDIDLQFVEARNLESYERAVLNVLKATLQYPADPQRKAEKLASDIVFFCQAEKGADEVDALLWSIWSIIIDVACCIPPGHPWQDSLIACLDILRRQDGAVPNTEEVGDLQPPLVFYKLTCTLMQSFRCSGRIFPIWRFR